MIHRTHVGMISSAGSVTTWRVSFNGEAIGLVHMDSEAVVEGKVALDPLWSYGIVPDGPVRVDLTEGMLGTIRPVRFSSPGDGLTAAVRHVLSWYVHRLHDMAGQAVCGILVGKWSP